MNELFWLQYDRAVNYLGHGTEPSVSRTRIRSGPVRENLYTSGSPQSMCWPVLATELQQSDTSTQGIRESYEGM